MGNIAAIEQAVMTTTDEKMLKQMAESMPFNIYQQLSPEARGKLAKVVGKESPAASPYTGVLPMKEYGRGVNKLREVASQYENTTVMLPVEIISVIEGKTQEKQWGNINAAKVIRYVADMLEV